MTIKKKIYYAGIMTSRTVVAVGHAYLVSFFQTFLKGQTALSSNGTHVCISLKHWYQNVSIMSRHFTQLEASVKHSCNICME